jgi:hypothetical protein
MSAVKDVLNIEVARWLGVFDPWGVVRAVVVQLRLRRGPRRIEVPPMSDAWLAEHERQSGQHPEW